ncbi:hypothetical protein WHR41_06804 [Cladosporium halotolerans]|uniref:Cercosporin MFS transporter CTB4 n=1 Tax=Cladosporium halotolerans TaxID=1052096 RepID=A0AB34KL35_9PEZI
MADRDDRPRPDGERQPLLQRDDGEANDTREVLAFTDADPENPRQWPRRTKMANVAIIAAMSILSPLASSMFTPGIQQIADGLGSTPEVVIGCTTGFVIMLGLGPLFLAPLSETFGRRKLYIVCFTVFSLLQIPSALAPNVETLIAMRTLSGFFGSVGIANGGGTISDMFEPSERAGVFGWYLLGPLLGPTLGPLFGGVIVQRADWRWIFWVLTIVCFINTFAGWIFLRETYAPALLERRKQILEQEPSGHPNKYRIDGQDERPMGTRISRSLTRPLRILVQPIVLTMSTYQALLFGTTYSIYTNMQPIYSGAYGFSTEQVGLLYLGPGLGFLTAVWFLVPRIDTVYNSLAARNGGKAKPEYRLPLANIGAAAIPAALFWFAWTVQLHAHWFASIAATFFYGVGQVMIINTCQNYYIDSFEKYAASAIAAGAAFRSVFGAVVPLWAPALFDRLGYGWGISVFGFLAVAIAPAPAVFYFFGEKVRERFWIDLDS